jgi:hypothetical protein
MKTDHFGSSVRRSVVGVKIVVVTPIPYRMLRVTVSGVEPR